MARGERVTRALAAERGLPYRYFRHPYLHTGTNLAIRDALVAFLAERGLQVAPVTIDNSEWIFARAYDEALDLGDAALTRRLGTTYVDYMEAMTAFYEKQSTMLFEREIPQVLLLHANELNADHLGRLLDAIEERGYELVHLEEALADPAYDAPDAYHGAGGVTWIHRWAITRGVDRSSFGDEPRTPRWVQEIAGIEE